MTCTDPKQVWPNGRMLIVPCTKCLACLTNKRKDWIFRLEQEYKASKGALFITLTYHPKYCPEKLSKSHLQKFMKRLRKRESDKIRYYAVGEYGTKFKRPHYHILLFNCDQTGEQIRKSWKFGIIHIGKVTQASIAYCTKYVIQPTDDEKKSFTLMSRGYGIGINYLSDAIVEWHRADNRNYAINYGVKNRLPRYYKEKIWYRAKTKRHNIIGDPIYIEHASRKLVSSISTQQALEAQQAEKDWFIKRYGDEAENKQAEFRNAQLARIKTKVAFTQTL